MCLENERAKPPTPWKRTSFGIVAWKVVERGSGVLCAPVAPSTYRRARWLTTKTLRGRRRHLTGFHVFRSERRAREWGWGALVVRVFVRDVLAYGDQGGAQALRARRLYIPAAEYDRAFSQK